MLKPKRQFLIILEGPMGSGKSTVAGLLKGKLTKTVVLGIDKIKWFQSDFKRGDIQNSKVEEVVYAMARTYLRQGFSVILENGFWKNTLRAKYRNAYLRYAKRNKIKTFIYHLTTPAEVSFERVAKRKAKSKSQKLHPPNPLQRIRRNITEHEKRRFRDGEDIDTVKHSPLQITKLIIRDLQK